MQKYMQKLQFSEKFLNPSECPKFDVLYFSFLLDTRSKYPGIPSSSDVSSDLAASFKIFLAAHAFAPT